MRARRLTTTTTTYASADEKVNKASKAAKFVKKGAKGKLLKKRFSPTFHRCVEISALNLATRVMSERSALTDDDLTTWMTDDDDAIRYTGRAP
jgi:hypothetical protein